jgi:RNA polymerase sigma-70 factor (ECF subfamily)
MDPRRRSHDPRVALTAPDLTPAPAPLPAGAPAPHPPGSAYRFEELYDQHFAFVWRTARRLGVAERSVDDAVQDVFIVVHRRLADFEGRSSIKSWLFGIVRRVAKDHRRRARRKDRGEALPDGLADPMSPSPRDAASRAEALEVLYGLLESLDDDKREVFVLAELEQMTVPEIAEAISVNLNTVYSRLRAARQAFEKAVARYRAREERERR